jgi:hypothetical protein
LFRKVNRLTYIKPGVPRSILWRWAPLNLCCYIKKTKYLP